MSNSASPSLHLVFVIVLQLVVSIVFLNALIAIMGDTFEKMQDSKQESMTINRGQLVVEFIESTLAPEEIKEMQAAYRWLHSIQPRTWAAENGGAGGGDQWAGRIKAIRKLVEDQLQQGRRQSAGLAAQIEQVQGSVKSENAGVSQRMETIESRLAEVIAMLQNL